MPALEVKALLSIPLCQPYLYDFCGTGFSACYKQKSRIVCGNTDRPCGWAPVRAQAALLPVQVPDNMPGKAATDGPSIHMVDPDGLTGSRLCPGQTPAIVAIWRMDQTFLYVTLCNYS